MSVIIPEHISIIGVYTSHFALLTGFTIYIYNDICFIICLFYVCSIFNWKKVYSFSWIKLFDIITAVIILNYITFYSSRYYKPFYKHLWDYSLFCSIISFVVNNYIFYLSKKTLMDCYINVLCHISVFHIYMMILCITSIIYSH